MDCNNCNRCSQCNLYMKCVINDLQSVKKLCAEDDSGSCNVNYVDSRRVIGYFFLARYEDTDDTYFTPIEYATFFGNLDIVTFFLEEKHVDIGLSAHIAAYRGWCHIMDYFVKFGYDVDRYSKLYSTPIYQACKQKNIDIVDKLVQVIDINNGVNDPAYKIHPVQVCAMNGFKAGLERLIIIAGADKDITVESSYSYGPLELACYNVDYDIVEFLVGICCDARKIDLKILFCRVLPFFQQYKTMIGELSLKATFGSEVTFDIFSENFIKIVQLIAKNNCNTRRTFSHAYPEIFPESVECDAFTFSEKHFPKTVHDAISEFIS